MYKIVRKIKIMILYEHTCMSDVQNVQNCPKDKDNDFI